MHQQGLSEETVEPDSRLEILLHLIALAVHLLEDEEEKVQFIPVQFILYVKSGTHQQGLNMQLCLTDRRISTSNKTAQQLFLSPRPLDHGMAVWSPQLCCNKPLVCR